MQLTNDGEYQVTELFPEAANSSILTFYTSGAGTARLTYSDDSGQDIDITDGDITAPSQTKVCCGYGANLFIQLSGVSAATPFNLEIRKVQ